MTSRRERLHKITHENQLILSRLQSKKSAYSVEKWEKEYDKHNKLKEMAKRQVYVFG